MEIITSHQQTDFDGLAAMVAAQKIHPQAVMVFSGKLSNNVKQFMALYKDRINIKYIGEINKAKVTKIIIVDTRVANRIGEFSELVKKEEIEVLVYDHHLDRNNKLTDAKEVVKPVGATTTLLVNQIKERGLFLTSFEATLFALGIYEDTGSLIYSNTTAQDAKAVAYLLEAGANLDIIEEYIEYSLTRKQQQLFNKLLDSLHQISIKGFEINTFQAEVNDYIPDISLLAHKLNELHNSDALFMLVKFNNSEQILIIARSNHKTINVAQILSHFGGGGHDRAASATIRKNKKRGILEWEQELLGIVREKINPAIIIGDVMSKPVKTVNPTTTMQEADEIMLRWGHSGLVVTEDDEIVGIISRRDIDKVRNHGLLHAPVKGYMSTKVVTIKQDAPLKKAQNLIVKHDIGRLPVINSQGELVGIITRSDLLKVFYGQNDYLKNRQNPYGRSLVEIQEKRYNITNKLKLVNDKILNLLKDAGKLADKLDFKLYIVGGFVRDLLLDKVSLDLDLVVEGDGIKFARKLAQEKKGSLDIHHDFGTAIVEVEEIKFDIATTRVEYYPEIASLPEVKSGSIEEDLFRRDFTINALAIQLNQSCFGQLVDFFNGKSDLEEGIIRLLHNFSLHDDPTRIFRGLRFVSRYNYQFDSKTEQLIKQAISLDVIDKLSPNRLFNKLKIGLKDENPILFINLLKEYDVLVYIDPNISWNNNKRTLAKNISRVLEWVNSLNLSFNFKTWILYLMILVLDLTRKQIENLCNRYSLSNNLLLRLLNANQVNQLIKKLHKVESNSSIYYILSKLVIEDILFILIQDFSLKDKIKLYLEKLQWIDIEVSGEDIINLGYKSGPFFSKALRAVKKAKIDGKVENYQEELNYLKDYLIEKEEI